MRGNHFDYDFAVIGGGSGGMSASKHAAKMGVNVVCFDYVEPSPQGTKWGLGGTCVNVGCVPKKLFHYSARIGLYLRKSADPYGWSYNDLKLTWEKLQTTVGNYIKGLNYKYRSGLAKAKVEYINAKASFKNKNTIIYTDKDGNIKEVTAKNILICVGGRPYIPQSIEGAKEYCITSDDLFWLKKSPGKTLVVGGSYIALECAGFLLEYGYDVTICVRSILLRGFDRQSSEKVGSLMEELGCKFIYGILPKKIVKLEDNRLKVIFSNDTENIYDTVLYAVGRVASTSNLNLELAGVKYNIDDDKKKIITDKYDRTNIDNIYAIGDVVVGRPELTPTAIAAGIKLVERLFNNSNDIMDYSTVPTVVFTPFEYGCCGLSEENAIDRYGEENIDIYLSEFNALEVSAANWEKDESQRKNIYDNIKQVLTYECLA